MMRKASIVSPAKLSMHSTPTTVRLPASNLVASASEPLDFDDIWITPADYAAVATLCGVHRTTVARWVARKEFPVAVHRMLDLIYNGNLSAVHPDWEGFRINPRSGEMDTPTHRSSPPGEIMAIQYNYQLIAALQAELRELRAATGRDSDDDLTEPLDNVLEFRR